MRGNGLSLSLSLSRAIVPIAHKTYPTVAVNQNQPARFTPASPTECRIVGFWIIGEECGGRDGRWNPPIAGFRWDCESDAVITDSSRKSQGRLAVFLRCDTRVATCSPWERLAGDYARALVAVTTSKRSQGRRTEETEMKLSTIGE
jgi:hypothetical protein